MYLLLSQSKAPACIMLSVVYVHEVYYHVRIMLKHHQRLPLDGIDPCLELFPCSLVIVSLMNLFLSGGRGFANGAIT